MRFLCAVSDWDINQSLRDEPIAGAASFTDLSDRARTERAKILAAKYWSLEPDRVEFVFERETEFFFQKRSAKGQAPNDNTNGESGAS